MICVAFFAASSCKHKDEENHDIENSNYPLDVAEILVKRCATSGCHDNISKDAASGLSLITWTELFKGGNGGAVVIPYRPDQSTLMYYVNHDSILGIPGLTPTMPINQPALTTDELNILQNWIAQGAPDRSGFVKFSDNPYRKKYYVTNQGCDLVYVFDAASNLAMRVVDVGSSPVNESPHMVRVASDNLSWFVCFVAGTTFQQYSTLDNSLIAEANIGGGQWNTFALSPDEKKAYVVDFANGKLAIVDLLTQAVVIKQGFGNIHGSATNVNAAGDTLLYITAQQGSYIFKIPVNDMVNFEIVPLRQSFPSPAAELEPHDIIFSPDHSKYYVTCQESNDVRVVRTSDDVVIAAIPVGLLPQEMAVSKTHPYLFVTCMDAVNASPSQRGSVAIIDYQTDQLLNSVYTGYQPHGIAVDDVNDKVIVANRNVNPNGPAPHHTSLCAGRNGNVSIIDMITKTVIPGSSTEVSVDPYSVGITH